MPTRDEFVAFLRRCVDDPAIRFTEAQAAALLADFDAGRLSTLQLPLPLPQAILPTDDATRATAASLVEAYLARQAWRTRGRNRLRASFMRQARQLASDVVVSGDVAVWQTSMRDMLRVHMPAQAYLGAAGRLPDTALPRLDADTRQQAAYLSRMSDALTAAKLLGAAWSVGYIANRAAGYAGGPWGWFFKGQESTMGEDAGYVAVWRSSDDDRVCENCQEAEAGSPYLLDDGPYPGADTCLGGGRCRCEREIVYDRRAYRELIGG